MLILCGVYWCLHVRTALLCCSVEGFDLWYEFCLMVACGMVCLTSFLGLG